MCLRRLPTHRQSGNLRSAETMRWRTEKLAFALTAPDQFRLKNKLTGKIYAGNANSFDVSIRSGDKTVRMNGADFAKRILSRPAPDSLRISYEGPKQLAGVRVDAIYTLARDAWFVRKHLRVTNGTNSPILIREANVENCRIAGVILPGKPENPLFLDDQLFWGLEWPIASATVRNGCLLFGHSPGVSLSPGESWVSKTCGFGVSQAGRAREAFGRYIQEIRANRVDFATFYFDWLCHDNSGPLESEILMNFAALKRLKELYGLQFDIYNSDAGLVEAPQTYFPQYRAIFERRFPKGLKTVADVSTGLGMRLGLWIGPDGFGERPDEMKRGGSNSSPGFGTSTSGCSSWTPWCRLSTTKTGSSWRRSTKAWPTPWPTPAG